MADRGAAQALLAILGGTFDPIHYGHLRLADDVRRALMLPEVRLIPAGDPPHRTPPQASAADRLAMTALGVVEFPGLAADAREVEQSGKSYTVRTLEALRKEAPARPLALIVGADALAGLTSWHRWRDVFALAHLIVIPRPGVDATHTLPAVLASEWKARWTPEAQSLRSSTAGAIYEQVVMPQPISASEIRAALARGRAGLRDVERWLPPAVLAYIEAHKLYGYA
jgi:nicotinate-nucleotide adenylyltransferase